MDAQQQVAQNTADRDGWTVERFAARQVCKLVEKLGELSACVRWSTPQFDLQSKLNNATWIAHAALDSGFCDWEKAGMFDAEHAKSELAGIQVAVFNLAAALAEITGEPFDVVQAAVEKSAANVERGAG